MNGLDLFLEASRAARGKGRQAKAQREYLAAIRARFRHQAAWIQRKWLPQLKGRIAEALREADQQPLNTAEKLELIAKLLQQLQNYPDSAEIVKTLNAALALAYGTGAADLISDVEDAITGLEIDFGLDSAVAVAWLKDHSFENLAKTLDETTAKRLETILVDGLAKNLSYSQIAAQIKATFAGFTAARARRIAVTEIGNAYSEATLAAALDISSRGIALEKAILTAGDDRVEAECLANEAAGWIQVGDNFPSGQQRPLFHIGCRCALLVRRATVKTPEPELVG